MALFRRRRSAEGGELRAEVDQFWAWWDVAQGDVASALDDDDPRRLRALLEIPVRAVHPDLTWHASPGVRSRFMLVLSGARHPALRVVTERWRQGGPQDSPIWEFHPAMPPEPAAFEALVQVGGLHLEPGEAAAMVALDDRRFRADVTVFHPAFTELDDGARSRVANVLVGWALGEDDTDRWIGQIHATTRRPLDSVPVSMLGALTSQFGERWGGERWLTLEGSFGTARLIAAVRHPLHRVDYPLFDEHIEVRLSYRDALPDGLPDEEALSDLLAVQDAIVSRLGSDAVLVAVQTASGERLLHFYADSTKSPLAVVQAMLHGYLVGEATTQARLDPGWDAVDYLRAASDPG